MFQIQYVHQVSPFVAKVKLSLANSRAFYEVSLILSGRVPSRPASVGSIVRLAYIVHRVLVATLAPVIVLIPVVLIVLVELIHIIFVISLDN